MQSLKNQWHLLHQRPVACLSLGTLLTYLARGSLYVILPWLAVEANPSALAVAYVLIAFFLPQVVLGFWVGSHVGRWPRLLILCRAQLWMIMVFLIFIPIALWGGTLAWWAIIGLALAEGLVMAYEQPAIQVLIPEMIGPTHRLEVNAMIDIMIEIGALCGMGMCGFLLYWLPLPWIFTLLALLCIAALIALRATGHHDKTPAKKTPYWPKLAQALQYVLADRRLLTSYVAYVFVMILFFSAPVIFAPYAKVILNTNAFGFGLMEVSVSFGVILGGLLTPWLSDCWGMRVVIIAYGLLLALGLYAFHWVQTLPQACVLCVGCGICYTLWAILMTQTQNHTLLKHQASLRAVANVVMGLGIIAMVLLLGCFERNLAIMPLFTLMAAMALLVLFFAGVVGGRAS